ncbi:hypothetical protein [Marinobacter orientalis]|uniref:Uncharacterized protein n=1 Tax=Marinobacter orientalis TaxID=1928859 RepID=A0A7Y0WSG9_9GAMM|nr:hypothetical protein [Marinobacter orientalis]NMT63894.1 hypothetical protein [Marinobacter orientalis]TGX49994.1 hypothetical protein DIT72_09835 [Marinobacter orientalis]
MTSSVTIQLQVGSAIPPGNEKETPEIIEFWRQVSSFFADLPFSAQDRLNGSSGLYRVGLNAEQLVAAMENARDQSDSFSRHRLAHIEEPDKTVACSLSVTVSAEDHTPGEEESYQVATVFIQQLVMAINLLRPGAIQLLDTRFTGEGAHRYEAQNYDSRIFYGARKASQEHQWPPLKTLSLEEVWSWLEGTESSRTDTAIKSIDKVLFTLLKVAEQRHEYSARTALLVMYQLEMLLECRQIDSLTDLRHRTAMILGAFSDSADSLSELHEARNGLVMASVPVHRPPLICHTTENALRQQFGQHHSAVESGTALVLALVQDLISHGAQRYRFTETMVRD